MTETLDSLDLDKTLPDDLPVALADHMRAVGLGAGGLFWRLGMRITQARPDLVCGTMPVTGNTQPYGVLHGGASAAFAETLASVAAALHAGPTRLALGLEVNATHHRSVGFGLVHGTATAVHRSSSMATYEVRITDDEQHCICTCRVTCVIRPLRGSAGAGRDARAAESAAGKPGRS
jgi:uncharacterized protein (TIGR00369 family)